MARFVGTKVEFGADADEFALNADARALPLIHSDPHLNDLLLKYCEAALADRRGDMSQLRTKVENAISSLLPHGRVLMDHIGVSDDRLIPRLDRDSIYRQFCHVTNMPWPSSRSNGVSSPGLFKGAHHRKCAWLDPFLRLMSGCPD